MELGNIIIFSDNRGQNGFSGDVQESAKSNMGKSFSGARAFAWQGREPHGTGGLEGDDTEFQDLIKVGKYFYIYDIYITKLYNNNNNNNNNNNLKQYLQ